MVEQVVAGVSGLVNVKEQWRSLCCATPIIACVGRVREWTESQPVAVHRLDPVEMRVGFRWALVVIGIGRCIGASPPGTAPTAMPVCEDNRAYVKILSDCL